MKTYLIGNEESSGYARDVLERVERLDAPPDVWCPITASGFALMELLLRLAPAAAPKLIASPAIAVPIGVSRDGGDVTVSFPGESDPAAAIQGKSVLLLDGAIHSGRTMVKCAEEVMKLGARELISYSLVVKDGSSFIPTIWGLMIDETDRAFFLLDKIPNQRLDAGGNRKQPSVHIERLAPSHTPKPAVVSGVASMDRATWSDRLYQMSVADDPPCTYVLVKGNTIVGYLTVHFFDHYMSIDEVAIADGKRGEGYGGILMRFADTLARQADCRSVRLNGIDSQVSKYEGLGYQKTGKPPYKLDQTETYWPMNREVLYHQRKP